MSYKKANGKKFIGIFICAVAILIAVCIAVPFFSKEEGYRMITVFEVSGTVGVVKDGIEYEAYPGMHLQEGHVIVTSEDSYARLVLDDDKYVKVEAGSRLEFETLGLLGTNKTRLKLDRGAITTEIVNPLGADEEYVVNTPNAVLAVRGTFFRVDLRVTPNGEIDTNVYTYGGKVASNRVMPTGEMIEEEVIVDAGYMTAIRMDALETIYIVGMAESPTGEPVEETRKNTVPIEAREIPDEDLVDMYFASENGHEMFLSTDEIKENIEEREISIEEQAPVYDKANEVKEQEESNTENTTSTALIPDDRGDWEEDTEVAVEDTDEPQQEVVEDVQMEEDAVAEVEDEVVPEEVVQETPEQVVVAPVVPPVATVEPETEAPHTHDYVSEITTPATCTDAGIKTYTCTCGDSYTEELPATGHTEKDGGTQTSHIECANCGEVFSDSHSYTDSITKVASCTEVGETTHTCTCGYAYTTEIAAIGHTEETQYTDGTADADGLKRVYCKVCNETFEEEVLLSISKNFPDAVFASYISTTYDLDGHNSLSTTELATLQAATEVNVAGTAGSDGGIASLEGISYFTSMQILNCGYNASLTDITLRNMPSFTTLNCNNTAVTHLYLNTNGNFRYLNTEGCTDLLVIDVKNTEISTIDVTTNTNITSLDFQNTSIANIDLSNNMNLEVVRASGSTITSLDLSGHNKLYYVLVENCKVLERLDVRGTIIATLNLKTAPKLTQLDITDCPELYLVETDGRADEITITKNRDEITID